MKKVGGKWRGDELMGFRERKKGRAVAINGEPLLCFLIRIYMCQFILRCEPKKKIKKHNNN